MSMQNVLRRISFSGDKLDARVATVVITRTDVTFVEGQWVTTPVGTSDISSEQYAVAFVRKYSWDEQQIKHIFGSSFDIEDLQYEMLDALYKAAHAFLKAGADGNWKAYLSHCLKTRLWDLGTSDERRAVHNPKSTSLQEYLARVLQIDDYTGDVYAETYPTALTIEDAYQQIADLNQARMFLECLTKRQRTIILMRWEHDPKLQDGATNLDICEALGISEKTLNNELLRIQRTFREYAKEHHETEWMAYLKKLQRRHV